MTVREAIENWVKRYRDNQFRLRMSGSIASFLGCIVVLFFTWWVVYFVLGFAFSGLTSAIFGLTVWTWLVMGLLFAAYFTANYEELDNLKFGSQTHLRRVRLLSRATGHSSIMLLGDYESFRSFVKIISVTILGGPALLMAGIRLLRSALDMRSLDPTFAAPVLIELAKAGKHVPMEVLVTASGTTTIDHLLEQMSMIDGVIIRVENKSGMYLRNDLADDLTAARQARNDSRES